MTDRVAEFLARADAKPVDLPVRDLLGIWGFRYRDHESTGRIQTDLRAAGLSCEPPFTEGSMRSIVRIESLAQTDSTAPVEGREDLSAATAAPEEADERLYLPQATLQIRDVRSATAGLRSVEPDASLQQVQHIMMDHGYSQLAVISGVHELKGAVSWESIAKARLAKDSPTLSDVIEKFPEVVHADQELLGQLPVIFAAGYVFVKERDGSFCGIVTNADLNKQFENLITPFMQLGEIERRMRPCISRIFDLDEIRAAVGDRKLKSPENMTFWQYFVLLKDPERWPRLHWGLDREMFAAHLDEVRLIRNHVMHFGAQPLDDTQRTRLSSFLGIMRHLNPLS
jgi:restriction system protein